MKEHRLSMKLDQKPLTSRRFLSATEAERVGMTEDVGLSWFSYSRASWSDISSTQTRTRTFFHAIS